MSENAKIPFDVCDIVIIPHPETDEPVKAQVVKVMDDQMRWIVQIDSETGGTMGPDIYISVDLLEALRRDHATTRQKDESHTLPLPWTWQSLSEAAAALVEDDKRMATEGQGEPHATIAQLEINLASTRDKARSEIAELERMLGDAQAEIVSLNTRLTCEREEAQQLTKDYDGKLKAQLDIWNAMMRDLEEERRRHASAVSALEGRNKDYDWLNGLFDQQVALLEVAQAQMDELKAEIKRLKGIQPQKPPKIETKTLRSLNDGRIADEINAGWKVVFETVIPTFYAGDYGPLSDDIHVLRFERVVQENAYTPLDVTVKVTPPAPEPVPEPSVAEVVTALVEDDDPMVGDWEDEPENIPVLEKIEQPTPALEPVSATMPPRANYLVNEGHRSSIGQRPRDIQRPKSTPGPRYADDAIAHEVLEDGKLLLGGWFTIDPAKMPIAATLMQHGKQAVIEGMNFMIEAKITAAMEEHLRKFPPRKFPPLLGPLGQQS